MAQGGLALTQACRGRRHRHRDHPHQKCSKEAINKLLRVEQDHPESITLLEAMGLEGQPDTTGSPVQLVERLEVYRPVFDHIGVP